MYGFGPGSVFGFFYSIIRMVPIFFLLPLLFIGVIGYIYSYVNVNTTVEGFERMYGQPVESKTDEEVSLDLNTSS